MLMTLNDVFVRRFFDGMKLFEAVNVHTIQRLPE